ncbi:mesothelin [Salvelinus sp. IW2-2015]
MEQINKWNITTVDTLAALMDNGNGEWDSAKAKVIFTKFLSAGNSLGASELNSIGGPNLCALDLSVLQGIRNDSLRDADALEITNCSSAHKKAFFAVAEIAFPINFFKTRATADQLTSYQLIQTYLGGANITYIRSLSRVNISMDINTFIGLDSAVVQALSVSEVSGLLGSNLNDLKTFENNTVVHNWVSKQFQSELDKLGIGLIGGRVDSNTTPMITNTAIPITNTTSGQSRGTYPAPLLFLFGLLFIAVQM